MGVALQKLRVRLGRQHVRKWQGAGVVGGCLAVRAERRRSVGRRRREAQHRLGVPGAVRVVRKPVEIRLPGRRVSQRVQGRSMQGQLPIRGQGLLDRQSRQFVPERDAAGARREHPGRQALLEIAHHIARHSLQQLKIGARR